MTRNEETLGDVSAPPAPFRNPAWFDPRVHQPCRCAACRGHELPRRRRRPLLKLRVALALIGGAILPLVTLVVNAEMKIVALGDAGVLLALLSVISAVAHLIASRVHYDAETMQTVHRPPRCATSRLLLMAGAATSVAFWGYLALLMLPLLPLSVLLVVALGLGLCGLTPYLALAVAIVQLVRDHRALRQAWGAKKATLSLLGLLLALPVGGGAIGASRAYQRRSVEAAVALVGGLPQTSSQRYAAMVDLAGQEDRLLELYVLDADSARRKLIAEIYHRLTDDTLNAAVSLRWRHQRELIRPFAFIDGNSVFSPGSGLFGPAHGLRW